MFVEIVYEVVVVVEFLKVFFDGVRESKDNEELEWVERRVVVYVEIYLEWDINEDYV